MEPRAIRSMPLPRGNRRPLKGYLNVRKTAGLMDRLRGGNWDKSNKSRIVQLVSKKKSILVIYLSITFTIGRAFV